MAGTAIKLSSFILYDNWPGSPNTNIGIPADGFDSTRWNFKTTEALESPPYPLGTKVISYTDNTNCPGWYTCMYLMFHDFSSQDISYGCVSKGRGICSHVDGVACGTKINRPTDTSIAPYYVVSRCTTGSSDVTHGFPICFPCASQTADSSVVLTTGDNRDLGYGDSYGWFWVGGVCPCKDITFLDNTGGDYKGADISVDTLMRAGPVFCCITSDGVMFLSCDATNLIDATGIVGMVPQAVGYSCISEGI